MQHPPCPACDGWSDSSSCSVSCGGGKKTQTYKIIAKGSWRNGLGHDCGRNAGDKRQVDCNTHHCPINCVAGTQTWNRVAINPCAARAKRSKSIGYPREPLTVARRVLLSTVQNVQLIARSEVVSSRSSVSKVQHRSFPWERRISVSQSCTTSARIRATVLLVRAIRLATRRSGILNEPF